jgi:hypothetical protein
VATALDPITHDPTAASAIDLALLTDLRTLSPAFGRAARAAGVPPAPGGGSAHEERLRLFDAVVILVERLARARPLLLALDDLHRASPSSRLLVRHMASMPRPGGMLLLGTYREPVADEALAGDLAAMGRLPLVTLASLDPLDRVAVGQLAQAMAVALAATVPARRLAILAAEAFRRTGGVAGPTADLLRDGLAQTGRREGAGRTVRLMEPSPVEP